MVDLGMDGISQKAVGVETLQDRAERLFGKLRSIKANLDRINGSGDVPEPKDTARPGLCDLLESCHAAANDLDKRTSELANMLGSL